ncbi:MAG: hypothetical protein Q9209_004677 [Squamulea sp. 1 TL-2023]
MPPFTNPNNPSNLNPNPKPQHPSSTTANPSSHHNTKSQTAHSIPSKPIHTSSTNHPPEPRDDDLHEDLQSRRHAAAILSSWETLVWEGRTRDESIPQTRLRLQKQLVGIESWEAEEEVEVLRGGGVEIAEVGKKKKKRRRSGEGKGRERDVEGERMEMDEGGYAGMADGGDLSEDDGVS